jgi:DNA topoisomerase-1
VLAAVVQLLEKSLIRVGNEEYAKSNRSFGLTTLQDRHVSVRGATVRFEFRGKSGVRHSINVSGRRLARIVRNCRDLPGQELFQYLDDNGDRRKVDSGDVNEYLQEIAGQDFTAKDFRTWAGTVLACAALRAMSADTKAPASKNVLQAIDAVAGLLGNTRAVCRKSYIHPAIIDAYVDGSMVTALARRSAGRGSRARISPDEAVVLAILQRQATSGRKKAA